MLKEIFLTTMILAFGNVQAAEFNNDKKAQDGFAAALPVVSALEAHKTRESSYPATLEALALSDEVKAGISKVGMNYTAIGDDRYALSFEYKKWLIFKVRCVKMEHDWQCTAK
jgi:hypothetical protein